MLVVPGAPSGTPATMMTRWPALAKPSRKAMLPARLTMSSRSLRVFGDHAMHAPDRGQFAPGGEIRRDRHHRRLRPLARDAQRRRARTGPADDRGQIERLGDLPRGVGDGVADGRLRFGPLRIEHAAIGRIALHFLADAVHRRDRLDRKFAGGGFSRQHDRVGAFIDGGGDVGDLGAGRHRRLDHRFQHLGCDHHRFAGAPRQPRHLLLQARHPLQRQLDAEIAARHHQGVGGLEDFGKPVDRLRLFDLGHHRGAAADQLSWPRRRPRRAARTTARSSRRPSPARLQGRRGPSASWPRPADRCRAG